MLICPESKRLTAKEAYAHPWLKTQANPPEDSKVVKTVMENLHKFKVTYKKTVV